MMFSIFIYRFFTTNNKFKWNINSSILGSMFVLILAQVSIMSNGNEIMKIDKAKVKVCFELVEERVTRI